MPITIPDFTAVGLNDPRAVGTQPQYPQESAVATAEGKFGEGLQKAGGAALTVDAYHMMARNKMDRAMADANWFTSIAQIDSDLKAETDPAKISALGAKYQSALQDAAGGIGDPAARELWVAENTKHAMAGMKGAQLRNLGIWRDQYKAGAVDQMSAVVRAGAQQDDPRGFDYAQQRIADLTGSLHQAGAMTATEAGVARKQAELQLIGGRAQHLASMGKTDEANALLDQNVSELDPQTLETLRARVKSRGDGALGNAMLIDAAGGARPAAPAGPSGDKVERFLDLAEYHESKGQNIPQNVVGPGGGYNPSTGTVTGPSSAQGYYQITNTTWKAFAPQAGVDTAQYPNAMAAPRDVQRQVARTIATTSGVQHWTDFNSTLRQAAQKEGLPVAGPIPADPAGNAQPIAAPDQIAVPAPDAPGSTPAPSKPPGMQDLANAEAELARRHAQMIANLENDPRAAANPTALAHALQKADTMFRSRQMAITAQKQAIQESRDAAADGYVQQMMKGKVDPQIVDQVAADPRLDRQTRENLWALYSTHTKQTAEGDTAKYGPKFFEFYQRITAPESDPNKLRDASQIYALASPKADGSQDLTLAGVDKLRQEMQASQRDPAHADYLRQLTEFYQGMRPQIDKSGAIPGLPSDGKGQQKFYEFQAATKRKLDSYARAGKDPADLLDPQKPDYLGAPERLKPYKRSMTEALKDFSVENNGPLGASQEDLSTPDKLRAAVSGGKISREQGEAEALKNGWIRASPPVSAAPRPDLAPLGSP